MKDRISLYPGRVKLNPVAGEANTFDMVRADQPTQEGTALNKSNLLSDETAALYGLGAEGTVDQALKQSAHKIGDVLVTGRNDLSKNWLLCNGAPVTKTEYKDLVETLQTAQGTTGSVITQEYTNIPRAKAKGIVYKDGYIAFAGQTGGNGETHDVAVWYKKVEKTQWTKVKLHTSSYAYVGGMKYLNGYYVVYGSSNGSNGYWWYTKNLESAWTGVDAGTKYGISDMTYGGGYWAAIMAEKIKLYSTINGTEKNTVVSSGAESIEYIDGKWIVVNSTYSRLDVFTSVTNPSFKNIAINGMEQPKRIRYVDGKYYVNGIVRNEDNSTDAIAVAYTDNLESGWTVKTISEPLPQRPIFNSATDFFASDGFFAITTEQYIYSTDDPLKDWETKELQSPLESGNETSNKTYSMVQIGDVIKSVQTVAKGGTDIGRVYTSDIYNKANAAFLPLITFDNAYAYIKAKGGE